MKKTLFALVFLGATPALAEIHEVQMFSRNDRGPMIYEPDYLEIAPGDHIRFIPAQPGHNAATIDSMIPEGATPFKSRINEDTTVTLTEPGVYGIKCSPHFAMGMVMLVKVRDAETGLSPRDLLRDLPSDLPDDLPARAKERFEKIIADNAN